MSKVAELQDTQQKLMFTAWNTKVKPRGVIFLDIRVSLLHSRRKNDRNKKRKLWSKLAIVERITTGTSEGLSVIWLESRF